jgi:hypothetical protein
MSATMMAMMNTPPLLFEEEAMFLPLAKETKLLPECS